MCSGRAHKAAVLEVHSLKGTDEAALGCMSRIWVSAAVVSQQGV